ncbi:IncQ-type mobilization protein MobB [Xylella fastidiosa]|uniref:IncQ-type mobilization protein MobB n=1 Tax=Xylella fastidiosa TaxID=2371 RepID=UPI003D06B329
MKLRQARNVEQIAEELEPLAVSLATLADQAEASIKNMEAASLQQAKEWNSQQLNAANQIGEAAKSVMQQVEALQQATANLRQTAEEVKRTQRDQLLKLVAVAGMSSILAAGLSIGLLRWLEPPPRYTTNWTRKR